MATNNPAPAGRAPEETGSAKTTELPPAYGTGKLLLAARDPHWLYAHWDLTEPQQRGYNALSADQHLILRVHADQSSSRTMREIHLRPESRHWFVRVERAETKYLAELGCYSRDRRWVSIATSAAATTPAETLARDKTMRWATIVPKGLPPQPGGPVEASGPGSVPAVSSNPPEAWTPERERALAEVLRRSFVRPRQMGSAEIAELINEEGEQKIPASAVVGISSFGGGAPAQAGFWFNINAELVLYGATDPQAQVTVGGQPIQVRPDGTFSCRFALPDGQYHLAAAAISAQGELRQADLAVSRRTEHDGTVGEHPQDPTIAAPGAEIAS